MPSRRWRCAIYTRKSTEEGLDSDFNSLDAQREAAEAYVHSQAPMGAFRRPARPWMPIETGRPSVKARAGFAPFAVRPAAGPRRRRADAARVRERGECRRKPRLAGWRLV